ncbi:MAG TPA: ABC transporter permease, partial [Dyadobacter sp.]|nr:ABC transporter permease [Dyadobacter sp.]
MFYNYIKIAFRNLRSGGWYSALNIGGLAVILAVSLLLSWWVRDELSFDRFHHEADRVYQLNIHFGKGEEEITLTSSPGPIAHHAVEQLPEVESVVRLGYLPSGTFQINEQTFHEKDNLTYADSTFLRIFNGFSLIHGNTDIPFTQPNSVVITDKLALKFFGTSDAIGKSFIQVETNERYTVSGVLEEAPDNSSFRYDMYINMQARMKKFSGDQSADENWDNYDFSTYIKLKPDTYPRTVQTKLSAIQTSILKDKNNTPDYLLQPLSDIHLHSVEGNEGAMQQVQILGIVAVLLISIGCINYVNLTTARATRRNREVGVRKVVGAQTTQLATQLLIESVMTLVLALSISLLLVYIFLPFYSEITGKSGRLSLTDPHAWQLLSGTLLFCFIMAGIYPAIAISGFNPMLMLRGQSSQSDGAGLRKTLVIVQFALATVLIGGTFIIGNQLRFIRERNPGFNREHVFTFSGREFTPQFKQALAAQTSITAISTSTDSPVNVSSGTTEVDWDGKNKDRTLLMAQMGIDKDFIPNFGIQLIDGKNFDGTNADATHFILNETAVKQAGIKDPIGKRFRYESVEGVIVGVVKDFSITTIRIPIWPLVMFSRPADNHVVHVHTNGKSAPEAIVKAENLWKQYMPQLPFEYRFLEEEYNQLYRSEQQAEKLFNFFAGVAILISSLGLLGLASFTAE